MPRKPIGEVAMSGAERLRRYRERQRAEQGLGLTDRQKLNEAQREIERLRQAANKPAELAEAQAEINRLREQLAAAPREAPAKPAPAAKAAPSQEKEIAALRAEIERLRTAKPAAKPSAQDAQAGTMTLDMISTRTGREQAELFMRQYAKRTEAEIRQRLHAEYQEWLEKRLTDYREKERHYNIIIARRKDCSRNRPST
jgi:hypothetical protein